MTAAWFHDGHHAEPHGVSVSVEEGALRIRSPDGRVAERWPASRVRAHALPGGAVAFRLANGLSRLHVDDPALLAALRPAIRRWRRRPGGWRLALPAAAAVAALAVGLVTLAPGLLAPLVPAAWEDRAGTWALNAATANHRVCHAPAGQRALDRLAELLARTANLPPIRVRMVDDATVNAFALPGRWIVLERGLVDTAQDGDELAGVLGHEAGHLAHHDPVKGLIRQLALSVTQAALGWTGLTGGGVAGMLLGLSYSRSDEAAADAFAVATLRAAGLRADGLGRFFAHMEAHMEAHGEGDGPSFLSDHPATATRRAAVAQPPDGTPAFDEPEWQAIRTMCANG